MENLNKLDESLDELISYIKNSNEYKTCFELKEKMKKNQELTKLITDIKLLQKKYVRSGFDTSIKQRLDEKNKVLEEIPIYSIYKENLEEVNRNINIIKDYLNDYFSKKMNNDMKF